jgi:hypothetical protein
MWAGLVFSTSPVAERSESPKRTLQLGNNIIVLCFVDLGFDVPAESIELGIVV